MRFFARIQNGLTWALWGIVLFVVFYGLVPLTRSVPLCMFAATVGNGVLALVWPALHSWVGAEHDPARRARNMGWFNISWSFGFALSPLLAGPLYVMNYHLPFAMLAVLGIASLGLIRSLPHERDHFGEISDEVRVARSEHDRMSEAFLYCAWAATLTANLLTGALRSVYPRRVKDLVDAGLLRYFWEAESSVTLSTAAATKFSWLAFGMSLATAVAFLWLGGSYAWRYRFSVLVGFQAAAAAACWALADTHSLAVMFVCCGIVGANLGFCFFSAIYYSVANPDHKHRRAAMNEVAVGVGSLLGSMGYGLAADRHGLPFPFQWTPLLVIAAIAAQYMLLQYGLRGRSRPGQAGATLSSIGGD
jgi:MFS family permease